MRSTTIVTTALALALLLALPVLAQQTVAAGPWSVQVRPLGPGAVTYAGQPMLQQSHLSGFTPGWKGSRFSLQGAEVKTTATGATWHAANDTQDATVTLALDGPKLTLTLDTTMRAAGPTEWAVEIAPEAVAMGEERAFLRLDGRDRILDLTTKFDNLDNVREMRFEQPERSIIVRSDVATLQDRRELGGGMFLVISLNHDGGAAVQEQRTIEFEVVEAPASEVPARASRLSQMDVGRRDVPVKNAGFEEGLGEWTGNPHATIDTETKHDGKQSARVTIPDEQTDATGIYMTQSIPVIEGLDYRAECWVKTQGVKAKTLGDKPPTGADIILEFADKEGNWLASGDYAGGVYGDSDWKKLVGKPCQAPAGAGYAIIFLSMRATGTGWFDDVKLTEMKHHVVLQSPSDKQTVADNTPSFAWQFSFRSPATVELSQDPAFPAGKTRRAENVQAPPYGPDRPLAPGTWYWRVAVPSRAAVSQVWSFEQTAPLTQDCTEPTVAPDYAYMRDAKQKATVRFADNVGVKTVTVKLDGAEVSKLAKVGKDKLEFVPAGGWKVGLQRLDVAVKDGAGNGASRRIFITHAPKLIQKKWLANGGVSIDGKPRFLLGMYGVLQSQIPEIAAAGYDFVHNYTWDGTGTNESAVQYMDEAQKYGMQAFIGFDRTKLQAFDEEFVAERVGALMRHTGLLAWYLFDEPDLPHQYVPPDQMRALYRLIKSLDPSHPVIVTVAQTNLMPAYNGSYDVYWSMDYSNPKSNSKNFEYHKGKLPPGTPIMSIVHSYDGTQKPGETGQAADPAKFQPNVEMMHADAFMAIAHNSSGLCWWWYGQGSQIFLTVANVPWAWEGLKETIKQIRALEPVLTAQVTPRMWIETVGEDHEVHFWEKKLADRTVIIAVNRDQKPCEAPVVSPALKNAKQVQVLFEDRTVEVKDGKLVEQFAPIGVHVYEIR